MARKSSRRSTVAESRTQKGKKKLEGSTSRSKRTNDPKEIKLKNPPLPQDSSSSDDIDGDYAKFLKTFVLRNYILMVRLHKILQVLTTWMKVMQSF
jgi:hypothetical protein